MTLSKKTEKKKLPAKRILVIRHRFIGDTILTVPFIKNLRKAYPEAEIDILVGPQSGEVLKGCPLINRLLIYDTTRFHKYDSGKGKTRSFWSYIKEIRSYKYDLVFLLKRSFSSAVLAFLSGAKYRVGYNTEGRSFLLTHRVFWDKTKHEVESTLDLLRKIEIEINDTELEAWLSKDEQNEIFKLVPNLLKKRTGPRILFHAAAAHPDKKYPNEHWAKLIQKMHEKFKAEVFFSGAEQDYELNETIQDLAGIKGINTAGKLSLRQSMVLYSHMDLAICTDSGPAHLASAVSTPTLAIFGPSDPIRWKPWGNKHKAIFDQSLDCRPCNYKKTCQNRECLTELDPDRIINLASSMISSIRIT